MRKILLSNENILKRLKGFKIPFKDKNGDDLILGCKVKIYYNIFDEIESSSLGRDYVLGKIEFHSELKVYYIELSNTPSDVFFMYNHNKVYFNRNCQDIIDYYDKKNKSPYPLFVNPFKYVEIYKEVESEKDLYKICLKILKEEGEKQFYKKIIDLYKTKQIKFDNNELSNVFIDLKDENLELICKFTKDKTILLQTLDFNLLVDHLNKILKNTLTDNKAGVFNIPIDKSKFDSATSNTYQIYWDYDIGDGIHTRLVFRNEKI